MSVSLLLYLILGTGRWAGWGRRRVVWQPPLWPQGRVNRSHGKCGLVRSDSRARLSGSREGCHRLISPTVQSPSPSFLHVLVVFSGNHSCIGKRRFVCEGLGISLLSSQISPPSPATLIHQDRSDLKMRTQGNAHSDLLSWPVYGDEPEGGCGGAEESKAGLYPNRNTGWAGARPADPARGWRCGCRLLPMSRSAVPSPEFLICIVFHSRPGS